MTSILESVIDAGIRGFAAAFCSAPIRFPDFWLFASKMVGRGERLLLWMGWKWHPWWPLSLHVHLTASRVRWNRMMFTEKLMVSLSAGVIGAISCFLLAGKKKR